MLLRLTASIDGLCILSWLLYTHHCDAMTPDVAYPWLHVRSHWDCCIPVTLLQSLSRAAGVPVTVVFPTSMSTEQRAWLRSTAVPLRSITFCTGELRSHVVMEPVQAPCAARRLSACILNHATGAASCYFLLLCLTSSKEQPSIDTPHRLVLRHLPWMPPA